METELAALDVLSPPFLTWFFREECPTHHLPLLAVFGRRSLAGWVLILPWTARAAIISGAAVGIAASLIYCWPRWVRGETQGRRTGRRGDGRDKKKEEIDFSKSETTRSNDDQQTSQVFDSDRTGVSSPLTPRVTIIPSATSSSSPSPSTYKITIIPSPTTTTTTSTSSPPPPPPPSSGTISSPQSPPPVDTDPPGGNSQFISDQFYSTVDGEIEGASISFLDSDDDQLEAIPLVAPPIAPPTNSNQRTMEFSLSYSASSDRKEEDEEEEESDDEENEGSYSLVPQSEQDEEEVVTQTIVTTL